MEDNNANEHVRHFRQVGDGNTMIASAENVTIILDGKGAEKTANNVKVPFGDMQITANDMRLLEEFIKDYDKTIIQCIDTDFTVPGVDANLSDTISFSYEDKWKIKSLKFRNAELRKIIFSTIETLNELTVYLSDLYMRPLDTPAGLQLIARNQSQEEGCRLREVLRPETTKLRYKLRDLYRALHPDDYTDIPPFEDTYEKYCEEHPNG